MTDHRGLTIQGIWQTKPEGQSSGAKVLFAIVLMLYEQFLLASKVPDDDAELVKAFVRFEYDTKDNYTNLWPEKIQDKIKEYI